MNYFFQRLLEIFRKVTGNFLVKVLSVVGDVMQWFVVKNFIMLQTKLVLVIRWTLKEKRG